MKNDYLLDDDEFLHRDPETKKIKLGSLRNDSELFDEELAVKHNIIRVRRVKLPKSGYDWEILDNEQVVVVLKGAKLTKKEKLILSKPEGLLSLISLYKSGARSVSKLKKGLNEL